MLGTNDDAQRDKLVNDMAKQVEGHVKNFTTVEFKGITTEIPRTKHLEFAQMRLNLMNLPEARNQQYSVLVRDVLLNKDDGKRNQLLTQIANQISKETSGP